jgi:transposase
MSRHIYSPTKVKHHLTCFNNIFSNNELISNRFAVFVTCTQILTYLWNRLLIDFYLSVYDSVRKVPWLLFNICVCERKLIFLCRVWSFIFYSFGMVRRKLTIPERWQAVGMHNGGFSHRRLADHFRVNHSIIARLMQRFRQTGNVTDRPRAGRPRKTTPREDQLISRRARQRPYSTAGALRGNLAFGGHISTRTVIRRLHHQGMRARRPI